MEGGAEQLTTGKVRNKECKKRKAQKVRPEIVQPINRYGAYFQSLPDISSHNWGELVQEASGLVQTETVPGAQPEAMPGTPAVAVDIPEQAYDPTEDVSGEGSENGAAAAADVTANSGSTDELHEGTSGYGSALHISVTEQLEPIAEEMQLGGILRSIVIRRKNSFEFMPKLLDKGKTILDSLLARHYGIGTRIFPVWDIQYINDVQNGIRCQQISEEHPPYHGTSSLCNRRTNTGYAINSYELARDCADIGSHFRPITTALRLAQSHSYYMMPRGIPGGVIGQTTGMNNGPYDQQTLPAAQDSRGARNGAQLVGVDFDYEFGTEQRFPWMKGQQERITDWCRENNDPFTWTKLNKTPMDVVIFVQQCHSPQTREALNPLMDNDTDVAMTNEGGTVEQQAEAQKRFVITSQLTSEDWIQWYGKLCLQPLTPHIARGTNTELLPLNYGYKGCPAWMFYKEHKDIRREVVLASICNNPLITSIRLHWDIDTVMRMRMVNWPWRGTDNDQLVRQHIPKTTEDQYLEIMNCTSIVMPGIFREKFQAINRLTSRPEEIRARVKNYGIRMVQKGTPEMGQPITPEEYMGTIRETISERPYTEIDGKCSGRARTGLAQGMAYLHTMLQQYIHTGKAPDSLYKAVLNLYDVVPTEVYNETVLQKIFVQALTTLSHLGLQVNRLSWIGQADADDYFESLRLEDMENKLGDDYMFKIMKHIYPDLKEQDGSRRLVQWMQKQPEMQELKQTRLAMHLVKCLRAGQQTREEVLNELEIIEHLNSEEPPREREFKWDTTCDETGRLVFGRPGEYITKQRGSRNARWTDIVDRDEFLDVIVWPCCPPDIMTSEWIESAALDCQVQYAIVTNKCLRCWIPLEMGTEGQLKCPELCKNPIYKEGCLVEMGLPTVPCIPKWEVLADEGNKLSRKEICMAPKFIPIWFHNCISLDVKGMWSRSRWHKCRKYRYLLESERDDKISHSGSENRTNESDEADTTDTDDDQLTDNYKRRRASDSAEGSPNHKRGAMERMGTEKADDTAREPTAAGTASTSGHVAAMVQVEEPVDYIHRGLARLVKVTRLACSITPWRSRYTPELIDLLEDNHQQSWRREHWFPMPKQQELGPYWYNMVYKRYGEVSMVVYDAQNHADPIMTIDEKVVKAEHGYNWGDEPREYTPNPLKSFRNRSVLIQTTAEFKLKQQKEGETMNQCYTSLDPNNNAWRQLNLNGDCGMPIIPVHDSIQFKTFRRWDGYVKACSERMSWAMEVYFRERFIKAFENFAARPDYVPAALRTRSEVEQMVQRMQTTQQRGQSVRYTNNKQYYESRRWAQQLGPPGKLECETCGTMGHATANCWDRFCVYPILQVLGNGYRYMPGQEYATDGTLCMGGVPICTDMPIIETCNTVQVNSTQTTKPNGRPLNNSTSLWFLKTLIGRLMSDTKCLQMFCVDGLKANSPTIYGTTPVPTLSFPLPNIMTVYQHDQGGRAWQKVNQTNVPDRHSNSMSNITQDQWVQLLQEYVVPVPQESYKQQVIRKQRQVWNEMDIKQAATNKQLRLATQCDAVAQALNTKPDRQWYRSEQPQQHNRDTGSISGSVSHSSVTAQTAETSRRYGIYEGSSTSKQDITSDLIDSHQQMSESTLKVAIDIATKNPSNIQVITRMCESLKAKQAKQTGPHTPGILREPTEHQQQQYWGDETECNDTQNTRHMIDSGNTPRPIYKSREQERSQYYVKYRGRGRISNRARFSTRGRGYNPGSNLNRYESERQSTNELPHDNISQQTHLPPTQQAPYIPRGRGANIRRGRGSLIIHRSNWNLRGNSNFRGGRGNFRKQFSLNNRTGNMNTTRQYPTTGYRGRGAVANMVMANKSTNADPERYKQENAALPVIMQTGGMGRPIPGMEMGGYKIPRKKRGGTGLLPPPGVQPQSKPSMF
jgi:hypothetical protein